MVTAFNAISRIAQLAFMSVVLSKMFFCSGLNHYLGTNKRGKIYDKCPE